MRYGIDILFNTPIPKAIYKSFIAMIKCLIDQRETSNENCRKGNKRRM